MLRKILSISIGLVSVVLSPLSIKAEESSFYFNDYSKEPELQKVYRDWKTEEKETTQAHEILPFKIDGQSYVQEFDVSFTRVDIYPHWFIGLDNGLKVFFSRGETGGNIYLHQKSGYLAKFEEGTFKAGDVYHVKLIYNNEEVSVQCIVTDKLSGKLIWDSGEQPGSSIYPQNIEFKVESKEGKPSATVEWDKERKSMHLLSEKGSGCFLEGYVDNISLKVERDPKSRIGWPDHDRVKEIEWVKKNPMQVDKSYKQVLADKQILAERIKKTRELFEKKILIGDTHSHSTFSDGFNTIREMKDMADASGLDFIFITDHRTLLHKRYCNENGLWWGQEPPTAYHDIGLLCPKKLFKPDNKSISEEFQYAQSIASFVFIPHPAQYWTANATIDSLWSLGEKFTIEILNGYNKLSTAYDRFSEETIHVWDQLLQAGKKISVLGASDAHHVYSVGTAWTGVFCNQLERKEVIQALEKGHSFASEAPFVWLECDHSIMGDDVRRPIGSKINICFTAVDSAGLNSVTLVKDGEIVKKIKAEDAPRVTGVYEHTVKERSYFRLECVANDQRRAFSSPLYIIGESP
ncbi:MAG: CehA/McbA family metallohydrolase [bacterium]|nr:CehA/McbA family metallohydrolase [bacterium]